MTRMLLSSLGVFLIGAASAQTPALRKGVSVQLPVTAHASEVRDADRADSLVVAITAQGTVYLEVTSMEPAELSQKVKAELAAHPGHRVYVKGDARVPYSAVASALAALQAGGVSGPILLTSQHHASSVSYVYPQGLEVAVAVAGEVRGVAVPLRTGRSADGELRQAAQRGGPVTLQATGDTPFGEVVHAVDVCRGAGAQVYLVAVPAQ